MKAQLLVNIVEQRKNRAVKKLSALLGFRRNKYLYLNDLT